MADSRATACFTWTERKKPKIVVIDLAIQQLDDEDDESTTSLWFGGPIVAGFVLIFEKAKSST